MIGCNGRVVQVCCKIYTNIEGLKKLLVPKIDSLWKHAGRKKPWLTWTTSSRVIITSSQKINMPKMSKFILQGRTTGVIPLSKWWPWEQFVKRS